MDQIQRLLDLPQEIANEKLRIVELKGELKKVQRRSAERESLLLTSRDNWGRNDKDRKIAQERELLNDATLRKLFIEGYDIEQTIAEIEIEVSKLESVFYAVRTAIEAQAAFAIAGRSKLAASTMLSTEDLGM